MSFSIWFKNTCPKGIFVYLLIPVVLVVILAVIPLMSEVKVGIFFMVVLGWSLVFPSQKRGSLNSKAVDFWYYSLAIVGVFLFFLSSGPEREKLLLREEYSRAVIERQEAEIRKMRLETIPQRRDELFAQMQGFAKKMADNEPDVRERLLQECSEALIKKRQEDATRTFRKDSFHELPKLSDPTAACLSILKEPVWTEIAAAKSMDEMLDAIDRKKLAEEFPVTFEGRTGSVSEYRQYLLLRPGTRPLIAALEEVNAKIEEKRTTEDKARDGFKRIGSEVDSQSSLNSVDAMAKFVWPYVLIIALGMKLARDSYCYENLSN